MQPNFDEPISAGEILARSSAAGEHVSDTAVVRFMGTDKPDRSSSRLVALACALVKDADAETRSSVAFSMASCAQFLNGTASDEVTH
jgi:hypothetical protein